jgi:hypothetical protein
MEQVLKRITVRSVVVLVLVLGGFGLAVVDPSFRSSFADLAKFGIGGYLGQMLPETRKQSD